MLFISTKAWKNVLIVSAKGKFEVVMHEKHDHTLFSTVYGPLGMTWILARVDVSRGFCRQGLHLFGMGVRKRFTWVDSS